MPRAMMPGKTYKLSLEHDRETYSAQECPVFFSIMPTMEESEQAAEIYNDFTDSTRFPKLKDLHEHGCKTLAPLITGWANMKDREGNVLNYEGSESLKKVLVLSEVMELISQVLRLTSVSHEQKKTSEP